MSEEEYETEKKRVKLYRNIFEPLVVIFLFAGIITTVLNVSFGGFTPVIWFLLAFLACPHYNLYGGNDDTSLLGAQEIVNSETRKLRTLLLCSVFLTSA